MSVRSFLLALVPAVLIASSASAQLPAGAWQYAWGDEFAGTTLDTLKWSYNYPWGPTHNHDAYMDPNNVRLGDGTLTLLAERRGQGGEIFTSGAVSSGYTRATFNGGYIEARIQLPDTPGSWPAFWGLYSGWPPEADIMEYPIDTAAGSGYNQDQYHTAFHYRNTSGGNSAGAGQVNPGSAGDLGGTYHNFGMEWREDDWVGFYFDGVRVSEFGDNAAIAQMQYMYLILNYAVGGWPGTPNTTEWAVGHTDETKVDWVRVWESAATKSTNLSYTGASGITQWDTAANWSNGSPNLGGVTANLGTIATASSLQLDWSGIRVLSALNVSGSTAYVLGGQNDRLILADSGGINSAINVSVGTSANQSVAADLELFGTTEVTNNSSATLTFIGQVRGSGGINIDGPGLVRFAKAGSYSGTTTIDSGAQGPGLARVSASHALGTGNVVLGNAGNATTARLELEGDSRLNNAISFNGRNSGTVGISNLSGHNTLAGTISAQVGGGEYIIDSAAGVLELAGEAAGAGGVALRNGAGGSRTFTLQGIGDGDITGVVENGNGTLHIIKRGTGTWSLNGANTYIGTTNVEAGTLHVDGATGSGLTTISADATLAGSGTVRGNLQVNTGGRVRVGSVGFTAQTERMIDNFSVTGLGQYTKTIVNDGNVGTTNLAFSDASATLSANYTGAATHEQVLLLRSDVSLAVGQTLRVDVDIPAATQQLDFGLAISETVTPMEVSARDSDTRDRIDWASIALRPSADGVRVNQSINGVLNTSSGALTVTESAISGLYIKRNSATQFALGYTNQSNIDVQATLVNFTETNVGTAIGFYADLRSVGSLSGIDNLRIIDPAAAVTSQILDVLGNLTLATGTTLAFDLHSAAVDMLDVTGTANINGVVEIDLIDQYTPAFNQSFTLVEAASLSGSYTLGGPDGDQFALVSTPTQLQAVYLGPLPGDYNTDGIVDAADYTMLRDDFGGVYTQLHYDAWQANFGRTIEASLAGAQVPEPTSFILLFATTAILAARHLPLSTRRSC